MTVNDSISAVYEVRFEGDPQRKAGFEDRESAIEFAEEHKSEKPTVWLINVEVDGEGYGGEETGECAVWSWDEGDLDFEHSSTKMVEEHESIRKEHEARVKKKYGIA